MKRKRPNSLRLEAWAWRGACSLDPANPQPEYRLALQLTNSTQHLLRFDTILVLVSTPQGHTMEVGVIGPEGKGGEGAAIVTLNSGESWSGSADTNGYTERLLRDARGAPLRITVAVKRRHMRIDGPFHGLLPDLASLPFDSTFSAMLDDKSRTPGKPLVLSLVGTN